jgi:hypothetical protein
MTADTSVFADVAEPMPAERRQWYRDRIESAGRGRAIRWPEDDGPKGDDRQPCAFCDGDGEVVNPENAYPAVKVTCWLRPIRCPRCKGTGLDPNP